MVVTESELREMWRDGRYALPAFPPGTRFSPAALDFLKDHQIEITLAEATPAAIAAVQLPTLAPSVSAGVTTRSDQLPFSLDVLAALAGLVAAEARRYQLPALAGRLDALVGDCQELKAAERQGRDPALLTPAPASSGAAFAPGPADHAILHWLNLLRASAGQAAAQAVAAGNAKVGAALEQVSATAANLGRQVQSGELGWSPLGAPSNRP
jgi:hypothetical protein